MVLRQCSRPALPGLLLRVSACLAVLAAVLFGQPSEVGAAGPGKVEYRSGGSLVLARQAHQATALRDGTILITGGLDRVYGDTEPHPPAEVYDPRTGQSRLVGDMLYPRNSHAATLLNDGTVLITGGADGDSVVHRAEIYDPLTETFRPGDVTRTAWMGHVATPLMDGSVLLSGSGLNDGYELWDPTFGFRPTGDGCALGGGVVVPIGITTVLIATRGGTEQLLDTTTGTCRRLDGPFAQHRFESGVRLLPSGDVLLIGSFIRSTSVANSFTAHPMAYLFDITTGEFRQVEDPPHSGLIQWDGLTRLQGDMALVLFSRWGDGPFTASFDAATGRFTAAASPAGTRGIFRVTAVDGGDVVITGGYNIADSAEARGLRDVEIVRLKEAPQFLGTVSSGISLVVFSGGSASDLALAAPNAVSFYVATGGALYGYIAGAPSFVNAAFNSALPNGVPANTPVVVITP